MCVEDADRIKKAVDVKKKQDGFCKKIAQNCSELHRMNCTRCSAACFGHRNATYIVSMPVCHTLCDTPHEHHLCSGQGTHANNIRSSISIISILDAKEATSFSAYSDWLSIIYAHTKAQVQVALEEARSISTYHFDSGCHTF